MLQISEIVKKTGEMFDLFNEHFYNNRLLHISLIAMSIPTRNLLLNHNIFFSDSTFYPLNNI
jgi:hypothetical protein